MKNTGSLPLALSFIVIALFVSSCTDDHDKDIRKRIRIAPGLNAQAVAQDAFIEVKSGMDIYFEEGTYEFTSQLSIDNKQDVRILGAGRDKTILSFKNQSGSGEGLLVNQCTQLLLKDFTIRDSRGDALKAKGCKEISFVSLGTVWSGEPSAENGAYGLYPVESTKVLIDGCYVYGASDVGIYVGQSADVVVRNCVAEGNVGGIEVENTIGADVYSNEVFDNTGGILVIDLPGLTQYGSNCRVFNNHCHENNRTNFAPPGGIVSAIPAGTGIIVLSTRQVEISGNKLLNNMFAGVVLASYLMIDPQPGDVNYNPLYEKIYVHDNTYEMDGTFNASGQSDIGSFIAFFLQAHGHGQPNILIDNLTMGGICISEPEGTTFVNLHAESLNPPTVQGNPDDDLGIYACKGTELDAVKFDAYGVSL
jgi:parallel beta-helix repeat protein